MRTCRPPRTSRPAPRPSPPRSPPARRPSLRAARHRRRPKTRCGYPGCHCHASPPQLHGPYHQWTRKKNGKTATKILTDEQLADYAPWFDNHKRLRELIAELEALSLAIAENDPRWNR